MTDDLTFSSAAFRLVAVLVLVLLNAFFVAAEFALVAVRRSRIDQMAAEGDRSAAVVQRALGQLDRYISGTQLGITLASLALGWIGEPAVASLVDRALHAVGIEVSPGAVHTGAGIAVAFIVITFLHIVLGELAPKSIALARPETVSRWVVRPLMLFSRVMSPFIGFLNGTANRLLALFGVQPVSEEGHVHSPEELRLLVMQARAHGTLDESDSKMLAGVFDFHNKKAIDVMRPRIDMVAIAEDVEREELDEILRRERYSRYPVYRDTPDDIVGVFLAKDFWLHDTPERFELREHLREALFVPATRAAERVLDDLRKTRAQLAVVLDEYGGTAGIVTMEDLIEEVVGDINDEYDLASREALLTDGVLELAGSLSLVDVRSDHRVPVPEGDWTTLGGYAFAKLGRLPRVGDRVPFPGGELEIVAMDGRRVAALRVLRRADTRSEPTGGDAAGAPSAATGRGANIARALAVVIAALSVGACMGACDRADAASESASRTPSRTPPRTPSAAEHTPRPFTISDTSTATLQDTIGPAAPPGAAASLFPAPSRPVADIVAPRWTGEDDRDDDGEFARVVLIANIRKGMSVADIGAGDGYYVARLSPLVGDVGRVFGEDIMPEYLLLLARRVRSAGWKNVSVVRGDTHDPRLPATSVDVALMIHMYHEIGQPFALLWNLATSMKPGGVLAILDLERPTYGHGTPTRLLTCELAAVGYRERIIQKTGREEYVALFDAPALDKRPTPEAVRAALTAKPCRAS